MSQHCIGIVREPLRRTPGAKRDRAPAFATAFLTPGRRPTSGKPGVDLERGTGADARPSAAFGRTAKRARNGCIFRYLCHERECGGSL